MLGIYSIMFIFFRHLYIFDIFVFSVANGKYGQTRDDIEKEACSSKGLGPEIRIEISK